MPPNLTAPPPAPTAKFMGRTYNTKPSTKPMTSKKPTTVTHIPLEPSTPPATPSHIPPAPSKPPKMERQFTCLPPSLQQAASNCSSDEQARIAECIDSASAFDGPCFDENEHDEQPFKGFVDDPPSFRNWDSSSSDDEF